MKKNKGFILLIILALAIPITMGIANMLISNKFINFITNYNNIVKYVYIDDCKKFGITKQNLNFRINSERILSNLYRLISKSNFSFNKEKRLYDFQLEIVFILNDNSKYRIDFYKDDNSENAFLFFDINGDRIPLSVTDNNNVINDIINLLDSKNFKLNSCR